MAEIYWTEKNKLYKLLAGAGYSRIDIKNMFKIKRNIDVQTFFENPKQWTVEQVELYTWCVRQNKRYGNITLKDVWEMIDFGKPVKDMTQAEMNVYISKKMWLRGSNS